MSRADRRYKKWERDSRTWARESARDLALDLYYRRASSINPYGTGVALEPGEVLYRQLWARYWTLGQPMVTASAVFVHPFRRNPYSVSAVFVHPWRCLELA